MKKLAVALFVAFLGLAFTAPAFALENQFGGYMRVRMFNQTDFDGQGNVDGFDKATYAEPEFDKTTGTYDPAELNREKEDAQEADMRTRLYYTAIINDNLKFVNKFEMDAVWGDDNYGDVGADGVAVEVKNTYIDFNYGEANIKLGAQYYEIQRGFIFADDASGIVASYGALTALYSKITEDGDGPGDDNQVYGVRYGFDLDNVKITPNFTYADLNNDNSVWHLGLDVDGAFGDVGYWGTFIYNGGEEDDADIKAFLVALGGNVAVNDATSIHGQVFYATGTDESDTSTDIEDFTVAAGASYYWSEIMGYGVFDGQASAGSPGDQISNIMAANIGVSYQATEKLTLGADLWYAEYAEDRSGYSDLGTEIDLSLAYTIIEGLRMHAVAAYLFADDATTGGVADDENPYEIGTQFSISF
jgi:hypothetical protein